ncbi:MAG: hypothetical protein JWO96_857 [Candidatus Saccharibacteria bacterium]|nr:hypothetical protein [Candidatus Saccharibacteria bacterium]
MADLHRLPHSIAREAGKRILAASAETGRQPREFLNFHDFTQFIRASDHRVGNVVAWNRFHTIDSRLISEGGLSIFTNQYEGSSILEIPDKMTWAERAKMKKHNDDIERFASEALIIANMGQILDLNDVTAKYGDTKMAKTLTSDILTVYDPRQQVGLS